MRYCCLLLDGPMPNALSNVSLGGTAGNDPFMVNQNIGPRMTSMQAPHPRTTPPLVIFNFLIFYFL